MRATLSGGRAGLGRRLALAIMAPLSMAAVLGALATPASAAVPPQVALVVPGAAATTLVATPVSIVQTVTTLHVTYSARLTETATGTPLAGQYVLFRDTALVPSANPLNDLLCEPITDANGWASCTVQISDLLNGVTASPAYTAQFFGTSQYLPQTATGSLALL
jgi:hypothetical protein